MTDLLSGIDAPSDAELISRVRGGDVSASCSPATWTRPVD
jgi:hypothetical protein